MNRVDITKQLEMVLYKSENNAFSFKTFNEAKYAPQAGDVTEDVSKSFGKFCSK